MVISVTTSKGGAGKTTLNAVLGANLFYYFGKKVAFLDIDPQQSLSITRKKEIEELNNATSNSKMYQVGKRNMENMKRPYCYLEALNPVTTPFEKIKERIIYLKSNYDVVILDFPGSLTINKTILQTLHLIDYLFIPLYVDKNSIESSYMFYLTLNKMREENKIKLVPFTFFNNYTINNGKNAGAFVKFKEFLDKAKTRSLQNNVFYSLDLEDYSTIKPISNYIAYDWTEEINNLIDN